MKPSLRYPLEKLGNVVRGLATGPCDVRSRLRYAWWDIAVLKPDDLPRELQKDFKWVVAKLTSHPAEVPGEGTVEATLRHMQKRTASKIAERLLEIWLRLRKLDTEAG